MGKTEDGRREAYSDFAVVYDTFMDNAPYEKWCGMIADMIEKYGVSVVPVF